MHRVLLILLLLVAGCKSNSKEGPLRDQGSAANDAALSDQDEIKIVVCEYLVTNVIRSPLSGRIFVPLNEQERRLLQARVPRFELNSSRIDTKIARAKSIHYIFVGPVKLNGPVAGAEATWYFGHTFMTYEFGLAKSAGWELTNAAVTRGSIAD